MDGMHQDEFYFNMIVDFFDESDVNSTPAQANAPSVEKKEAISVVEASVKQEPYVARKV